MVPTIPPDAITSTVPVLPVVRAAPPSLVTPLPPPVPVAVVDGSNHRAARLDGAGALPYSSVSSGVLPEFSPSPSIPVADRAVLPDSQPSVIPIPPPSLRLYSDTKACLPHWRSAIAEWVAADPSKSRHCDRILDHITHGLPILFEGTVSSSCR